MDTSSKPAEGSPEAKRQRLAVWHPHLDDVSPGRASTGRTRVQSDAPLKMFHRYYDRYLDNYQGYVKLDERLYLIQDRGEVPPGSAAERERQEKLRRANDGIERTTARLDHLEEYNAELATDDRVSRRASVARSYSEKKQAAGGRDQGPHVFLSADGDREVRLEQAVGLRPSSFVEGPRQTKPKSRL